MIQGEKLEAEKFTVEKLKVIPPTLNINPLVYTLI